MANLQSHYTLPGAFFFNDTTTTEIYTLSLHDALPICHARIVTHADEVTPQATTSPWPGTYTPADLQSAYTLPGASAGAGQTIAIVDAYDNPNAEADLAAYRSQFGLPPCTCRPIADPPG